MRFVCTHVLCCLCKATRGHSHPRLLVGNILLQRSWVSSQRFHPLQQRLALSFPPVPFSLCERFWTARLSRLAHPVADDTPTTSLAFAGDALVSTCTEAPVFSLSLSDDALVDSSWCPLSLVPLADALTFSWRRTSAVLPRGNRWSSMCLVMPLQHSLHAFSLRLH